MVVAKGISVRKILQWSGHHLVWLVGCSSLLTWLYYMGYIGVHLPWLPMSVIGTAVAFYIGFKNNQAYDRMWEARKIWGGIVNSSRAWGMYVDGFITNEFRDKNLADSDLKTIKKRLVYRHIGWLYTLRSQLLKPTEWEHISQGGHVAQLAERFQRQFGIGLVEEEVTKVDIRDFITSDELEDVSTKKNMATHIINEQSRDLRTLRSGDVIDDFRHIEMEKVLYDFYNHQGKCERIKKFPLPRQYANMSRYFVGFFLILLPFSLIPELLTVSKLGPWVSILVTALIGWIYVMMEVVGDYTENPFQGMANDIPMLSLCRTIEIDLREILGETELPPAIKPVNDVLM